MLARITTLIVLFFFRLSLCAQDSSSNKLQQIPSQYLDKVSSKATRLEAKLDEKADMALHQMAKQEAKIKFKLFRKDSILASSIFSDADAKYKHLADKLKNPGRFSKYLPYLDSLTTSFKFLEQNPQLLQKIKDGKEKLKDAICKVNGMEVKFQKAEEVKRFLRERKEYLRQQLGNLDFVKQLKRINKQVYYYAEQLREYKAILQDPRKIEKKAIELLSKMKFFQEFMQKNSLLGSIFHLSGNPDDPSIQVGQPGLQTRAQVNTLIQQQITAGGPNAAQQFQQNMADAQSQVNQLKNKITQLSGGSSEGEMPGFKVNDQKTKPFLKRLEYGANFQSQKATNFFPVTSDLGLSIGYKLNNKSIIGIGASYKLGWGIGWRNIHFSSQGIGLRSFIDWKIKSSLFISGGYEQNYKTAFKDFTQLQDKNQWQQSGLIGLSKSLSNKSRFLKKTKLQLLWDFLSYQQIPRTDALLFRVGYSF